MKKSSAKKAFTLLELSVTLVIIGILILGVMQGGSLVNAARLANARSFTAKSIVPQISGLVAWYETCLRTSLKEGENFDNAQTTEWYDASPGSIFAKKNKLSRTASADVTYQFPGINKTPTIQFTGNAGITLSSFYQGSTSQNTIFIVFHTNFLPTSTRTVLLDAYSSSNRTIIGIKNNAVSLDAGNSSDTATGTNPASFIAGADYIVAAYLNGTNSSAYVNNASTMAGNGVINAGTNPMVGITIGTDRNGNNGFNGFISEVIIYNRPLKVQERKDVMNYLSKKYRITITGL